MARDLHAYQYNGPDPSGELSVYPSRESAAADTIILLRVLAGLAESRVKPRLEGKGLWGREHENAVRGLRKRLEELADRRQEA